MDINKRSAQLERLEVVETGRRRRWSDDEKLRIVMESLQATRAVSSTARRYGISRSLLLKWRRSFSPEPNGSGTRQAGFVPAVVIAAETAPTAVAAPASGRMVIVVGKDRRVIVDSDVDAGALARVLQVLERR
jgi:transposase